MNSILKTLMAALLLTLAGAGGTVRAQLPPATVIEGSVETTTDAVIFPASLDGRVSCAVAGVANTRRCSWIATRCASLADAP